MELELKLDNTGFPLIWIDAIEAYVQWVPVTKIQLEYYLAATNDARFDQGWYTTILQSNPRIGPTQIRSKNYWNLFTTNILPHEANLYASWCGKGYLLPTREEWQSIYQEAANTPLPADMHTQISRIPDLKERPRIVVERLLRLLPTISTGTVTLADGMLLRNGVMEYVYEDFDRTTFMGMGHTNSDFVGMFKPFEAPQTLTNPTEGQRMHYYGFRLIYRKR